MKIRDLRQPVRKDLRMAWSEHGTLSLDERLHEASGLQSYGVEWRLWSAVNRHSCRDIGFSPEGHLVDYQLAEAEADFQAITIRLIDAGFRFYKSTDWETGILPHTRMRTRLFQRDHDGLAPTNPPDHERSVGHVPPAYFYADHGLFPLPPDWSGPKRQAVPRR